jgi:hypothetical protein
MIRPFAARVTHTFALVTALRASVLRQGFVVYIG